MAKSNIPSVMRPVTARQLVADSKLKAGSNVNLMKWGQSQTFAGPWVENESRIVADLPSVLEGDAWRVPRTQSIILSARIPAALTGNFAVRWQLEVGAGGGRTIFTLDAGGVQQVTVPAESLRASIKLERIGPNTPFSTPVGNPIEAVAFFADGSTSTAPPTYTVRFDIDTGLTQDFTPPRGATGYRIAANPQTASTPYGNLMRYDTLLPNSIVIDRYAGDYLLPIRHVTIPFNGQGALLQVTNFGAVPVGGFIEWRIDL